MAAVIRQATTALTVAGGQLSSPNSRSDTMPEEEPRILNRVCCAEERITELERTIAALRALVEAKDKVLTAGATNKLRMLAGWVELNNPHNNAPHAPQH